MHRLRLWRREFRRELVSPNRTKCKHGQGNNEVQVTMVEDEGRGRALHQMRQRGGRQTNNNNTAGNAATNAVNPVTLLITVQMEDSQKTKYL
jgi:hypothetical protein